MRKVFLVLMIALFGTALLSAVVWTQTTSRGGSNWSAVGTWFAVRTGSVTVTNGSSAVTGSSTVFTTELAVNDTVFTSTGTVIGKVLSITDNSNIVLTAAASINYSGGYEANKIPTSSDNVTIKSGHTVTVDASAKTCNDLTVENGATLVGTNGLPGSPRYVRVYGSTITNSGTIGTSTDLLGFQLYGAGTQVLTITGSGTTYISRIGPTVSGQMFVFDANAQMDYAGSAGAGSSSLYNNGVDNITLTVNAGKTVTMATNSYICVAASGTADPSPAENLTLNIYGTVTTGSGATVNLRNGTGKTTTLHVYPGGTLNCGANLQGSTGTTGAIVVTVDNGGTVNFGGSGTCDISGCTSNTMNGTWDFNNSATATRNIGTATVGSTGRLKFKDGTYPTGAVTLNTGSTVEYYGSSAISLGTTPTTYSNFTINNSAGVTLGTGVAVNGTLTLTSGNLTTTNANLLTLASSATVSGGSSSSFVNGPMAHTIASTSLATKTFPIGKGTAYRPVVLAITQGAATSTTYTAEVLNSAPVTNTIPGTLGPIISTVRYWSIVGNPITAITSSTVQITYDADDGVTDFAHLQIAQGPSTGGGAWVNLGGAGTANTSGTITSTNALTDFSTNTVYTLANTTIGTNVLPVELTSFTALVHGSKVDLSWKTATEVNNFGFDIERKTVSSEQSTVNTWKKVGFVEGAGTSNVQHNYSFTDNLAAFGKYSYRLKQIDRDGKFEYSKAVESTVGITPNTMILGQNYPNPFNPETSIDFVIPASGVTSLKVYNIIGEEVATLVNENLEAGVVHQVHFDGKSLPSGLYFYAVRSGNFVDTKKMLMVK